MSAPRFCGGMDWETALNGHDLRNEISIMTEFAGGTRIDHLCSASHDRLGDHSGDCWCACGRRWPRRAPSITRLFRDPNLVKDTRDQGPGLVFWLLLAACTALGLLGILQGWVPV